MLCPRRLSNRVIRRSVEWEASGRRAEKWYNSEDDLMWRERSGLLSSVRKKIRVVLYEWIVAHQRVGGRQQRHRMHECQTCDTVSNF
jgi:hypothetical protein